MRKSRATCLPDWCSNRSIPICSPPAKFNDVTVRRLYTDYVPKGLFKKHRDVVVLTRVESDPVTSQLGDFAGLCGGQDQRRGSHRPETGP
jgi:hypothetical protein